MLVSKGGEEMEEEPVTELKKHPYREKRGRGKHEGRRECG